MKSTKTENNFLECFKIDLSQIDFSLILDKDKEAKVKKLLLQIDKKLSEIKKIFNDKTK